MNTSNTPFRNSAPAATRAANDPAHLPQAVRRDWITHTLRGLEPWIGGSIALQTAWVATTVFSALPLLWLFVGYAALIALWCKVRPAHHQAEVFLRGAALVAGAYVLHTHIAAEVGGPGSPFFFWLSITVLYYAFMLKPAWGLALVALAALEFAASAWLLGRAQWSALAAPLGFLAIFPVVVAMRFGVAMRKSDEAIEHSLLDASTALYNMQGLLHHGQQMLDSCAHDRKPLSMVVIDCADLHEIRTIYGRDTARRVLARVVRKLNAVAGDRGLVARTAPTRFTVLLPGMTREKACQTIERCLGAPARFEYDERGCDIVIVPDFVVDPVRPGMDALARTHDQMCDDLHKSRQAALQRERYLTMERESHSHPAPLVPNLAAARPRQANAASAVTPPTVPVPLLRVG